MAEADRFNSLIISDDSSSRGKLKQATLALTQFKSASTAVGFKEGLSRLDSREPVDVIFISYSFGWNAIDEFIKVALKTRQGEDAAYILVLSVQAQKSENIAQSVFGGVHGCLFEPYSADNLREIAEIASKVRKENQSRREAVAAEMLLAEIIKHIDAFAFYSSTGKNTAIVLKKLKSCCQAVRAMDDDTFSVYAEVAIREFKKAKLQGAHIYGGVSERVKRSVEAKIAKELEAEYGG